MLSPGHPPGWFSYIVGYAKCDKIVQEIIETTMLSSVLLKTLIGHDSERTYFVRPGQGRRSIKIYSNLVQLNLLCALSGEYLCILVGYIITMGGYKSLGLSFPPFAPARASRIGLICTRKEGGGRGAGQTK